ncbi:cation diffusion facilitator family transporter [Acuticoccus mangrovi]|uniref:Cation diffusion facilitator family transporter n=1 Tax=Acuticoccus mangrovi TaxID=2796142 RepID=A0A934IED7_9HYPH|nr:cation diffusion facilitator family transporter [Acuticoccus mangrovi]MBJ3775054.1 cation diffusion facilitator family transporter [Acuticoccus mangrovi]
MAAKGNTTVIYAALGANAAIAVTKFAASAATGSSAMFAEGVHSVVDTFNQILLLFGLSRAKRPATSEHPFGHGKDLYFYAFMVAIMIFGAGAGFAAFEGIEKLRHPGEVTISWVNYAVLAAAFVFELIAWTMAFRSFQKARGGRGFIETVRRSKDPTLFTVLFEDSAAMLGLVVAFFGVLASNLTGDATYDALATLAIAAVLGATAVMLAIETKGLLVGEAADPRVVRELKAVVEADPGVLRVNEILTMHFGPHEILVTISADFSDRLSSADVEATVTRLENSVKAQYPDVRRLFIEAQGTREAQAAIAATAAASPH